jgi:hypothetical protein
MLRPPLARRLTPDSRRSLSDGKAVSGSQKGATLSARRHIRHFWLGWLGYFPNTDVGPQ